jgi:hypothetical protein
MRSIVRSNNREAFALVGGDSAGWAVRPTVEGIPEALRHALEHGCLAASELERRGAEAQRHIGPDVGAKCLFDALNTYHSGGTDFPCLPWMNERVDISGQRSITEDRQLGETTQ